LKLFIQSLCSADYTSDRGGVLKNSARASHLGNCLPCPKRGDHVPTLPCRAPVRGWGGSGALHGQPQPHTHVTCIYIHELNACSLLALMVHYWPTVISTDWAHLDGFILFILDKEVLGCRD
jgi:hypothetical protein